MGDKTFEEAQAAHAEQLQKLEQSMELIKKGGMMVGSYYAGLIAENVPEELAASLTQTFNKDVVQSIVLGMRGSQAQKQGDSG